MLILCFFCSARRLAFHSRVPSWSQNGSHNSSYFYPQEAESKSKRDILLLEKKTVFLEASSRLLLILVGRNWAIWPPLSLVKKVSIWQHENRWSRLRLIMSTRSNIKKKKIDICLQAESKEWLRQATGSVCVVGSGSPTSQSFLCLGGDWLAMLVLWSLVHSCRAPGYVWCWQPFFIP